MPEVISRLQQKLLNFWKDLDKSQKTRIYLISSILILALAASIILLARTTYVPLISSDDQKELSSMASILDEGKFKYKIAGDSILIDSRSKNKAQALLIQNDYPKSLNAIFSDAFDRIKLSSTESDKRKLFEEAQERTIAAKLKMLDNIEDASVDLALPEPSMFLFSDDEVAKPTASVMVKPEEKLSSKQVHAVVMWVARSVENLDPKDITVVDYNLNELTEEAEDELVGKVSNQYEMKKIWSEDIERNIKKMFAGQFDSFDNITVVANPVLDFNKLKSSSKTVKNPDGMDGAAIISSDKKTTKLVNGNMSGGTPGVSSNPGTAGSPSYQIDANSGDNSSYDEKHDIVNYGYDETQTEEEKATGEMIPERSSMAINLIYGSRVTDENKINEEIEKVKQIASSASGIPVANITVNKFKIAALPPVKEQISDKIGNMFNTYGTLILILLLAIGLMIAVMPRRKRVTEPLLEPAQAAATLNPQFTLSDLMNDPVQEIALEEKSEIKKQIDKFIKQKPDAVAQLLRNWLSDEWDN